MCTSISTGLSMTQKLSKHMLLPECIPVLTPLTTAQSHHCCKVVLNALLTVPLLILPSPTVSLQQLHLALLEIRSKKKPTKQPLLLSSTTIPDPAAVLMPLGLPMLPLLISHWQIPFPSELGNVSFSADTLVQSNSVVLTTDHLEGIW